jgi:hypothetical protein
VTLVGFGISLKASVVYVARKFHDYRRFI